MIFPVTAAKCSPLTSSDPSKAADCMIHQGRTEGGVCALKLAAGYKHDRLTSVCSRVAICTYVSCSSLGSKRQTVKVKKEAGAELEARSEGSCVHCIRWTKHSMADDEQSKKKLELLLLLLTDKRVKVTW